MAIYDKLCLSAGGGIISPWRGQQAENTVTILIGLGGTGIDCLRKIKTEVHNCLKPDDVNAKKAEYSHIRFLGVDDWFEKESEHRYMLPLDEDECFSLFHPDLRLILSSKPVFDSKPHLQWLECSRLDFGIQFGCNPYSSGVRQVGRLLFMEKADSFMQRLEADILSAKQNLQDPKVEVHIFTGLGGKIGSGCFLDVCYMVRHVLNQLGGGYTFGYFFLPDVNLSKLVNHSDDLNRYIIKNGYAAMKDLDYCMGLPKNGGVFEQVYQGGHNIKWNQPPVDMCHLVSVTDEHNTIIPNAYAYIMGVVTEYVMKFVSCGCNTNWLADLTAMKDLADHRKWIGANFSYCTIGAASASLPLKEINTYLASELFEKFSKIGNNTPTQGAVEELAKAALAKDAAGIGDLYLSVLRELRDSAGDDYVSYQDDWKFVLNFGNSDLIKHYTNQTAGKLNRMEANATSLTTETNNLSLSARVRTELVRILKDVNRGPIYGYKMLSTAQSHNLLNIVDGLIAENTSRWNQEAAQADLRSRDYEASKRIFETRQRRGLMDNDSKRFAEYECFLMLFEQHKLNMSVYRKYDEVLTTFRKQIEQMTSNYYIKLSGVMNNLIETFNENRDALNSTSVLKRDPFSVSLMTIDELKDTLDKEVESVNVDSMLDQFMALMIDNETEWIGEDENKICRLVNSFFVEKDFHGFANRSITAFLKDKYEKNHGEITDEQLTNYIYKDWMGLLTEKSIALFPFNSLVQDPKNMPKIGILYFPNHSVPITAAAEKKCYDNSLWRPEACDMTDRITSVCLSIGIPMAAFAPLEEYEQIYFGDQSVGRHLYEGKSIDGVIFSDWRKLPSLIPRCMINIEAAIPGLQRLISEADKLYDRARALHVLDAEGYICKLSDDTITSVKKLLKENAETLAEKDEISEIEKIEKIALQIKKTLPESLEKTPHRLPQDGARYTLERIEILDKDYFAAFPVFQIIAAEIINETESLITANRDILEHAAKKKEALLIFYPYCDALFSGIIRIEGRNIFYNRIKEGMTEKIILSNKRECFTFESNEFYQGYLTYKDLADDVKEEIKRCTKERIYYDASKVVSSIQMLKQHLEVDDRLLAWEMVATEYENKGDIIEFLSKLKRYFIEFCDKYAL